MDAEITLAERSQTAASKAEPGATATSIQPPKIRRFVFYGRLSRDNAAAFAAATAFFESAVGAAPHAADGRAAGAGLDAGMDRRDYVVYLDRDVPTAEGTKSKFEVTAHLAPERSGKVPAAVGYKGRPGRSILNFTTVNRSIIHCIRALPDRAR
jgi:hypothetical protein